MPWYRKNSSTAGGGTANNWVPIANVYRKNSDGPWVKLRRIYRKNSDGAGGNWVIVHDSDSLKPYYTVPPTLESNAYSPSVFSNGSTITLTRGTWANTGASFAPVSYLLEIQYSNDNSNWFTITNGTGTSISYTIPLDNGQSGNNRISTRSPSTYFRGKVTATNVNGSTFAIVGLTRSNIDMIVSSVNASTAGNDISISWVTDPSNNASNISNQLVEVKTNVAYTYNGQSFSAYQTVHSYTVSPGTNFSLLSIAGTNIRPSTSIYVQVTVTANDSAGTQDSNYSLDFTSPILVGTVDISPSFSVLNGYRRVESGSTVTAVPSGWPSGTTFTYEWYRSRSFQPADDIALGTGPSVTLPSSSSITGERIWVNIYGTYEGQTSSAVFSAQHRIIPAQPLFTLGGGSSGITITSLTATGGEFYFGTYSGPTSGTIPQTAIGADYSITGLSSGQYTVTLFSRAINGNTGYEVTTESNSSTSVIKSVTVLSAPTPTLATFSNGTFYIYFDGGSGPYYQVWYNTSTTPGINNPTTLGVTLYDFNGSSSPISWTPSSVSYGTTYNFWIRSSNTLTTSTAGEYSPWSSSYVQVTPPIPQLTFTKVTGKDADLYAYFTGGGPYWQVYWYPGNRSDIQSVTTYDASGTSSPINITNLAAPTSDTDYYFWVRSATSTNFTGTGSNPYYATNPSASQWVGPAIWRKLPTPTGVSATTTNTNGVTISWNAVTNASYYGIWWGSAPSFNSTPDFQLIYSTSYFDSSISSGASRTYYVQAFPASESSYGKSNYSSGVVGTRSAGVTAPSTPTGFSISSAGTASWNASSGATSYTLEWYAARNSTGTLGSPAVLGPYYYFPNSTSQQITYPTSGGNTYNWVRGRVRAENAGGSSSYTAWYPGASSYV